jgi:hypothetical protein
VLFWFPAPQPNSIKRLLVVPITSNIAATIESSLLWLNTGLSLVSLVLALFVALVFFLG